ncbi:unnamed protein product, partial [Strongylus vulgaris]
GPPEPPPTGDFIRPPAKPWTGADNKQFYDSNNGNSLNDYEGNLGRSNPSSEYGPNTSGKHGGGHSPSASPNYVPDSSSSETGLNGYPGQEPDNQLYDERRQDKHRLTQEPDNQLYDERRQDKHRLTVGKTTGQEPDNQLYDERRQDKHRLTVGKTTGAGGGETTGAGGGETPGAGGDSTFDKHNPKVLVGELLTDTNPITGRVGPSGEALLERGELLTDTNPITGRVGPSGEALLEREPESPLIKVSVNPENMDTQEPERSWKTSTEYEKNDKNHIPDGTDLKMNVKCCPCCNSAPGSSSPNGPKGTTNDLNPPGQSGNR